MRPRRDLRSDRTAASSASRGPALLRRPGGERRLPLQRRGHRRHVRRGVPRRAGVLERRVQDAVRGRARQPVERRLRLLGGGPRQRVGQHRRHHERRRGAAVLDRRREQQRLPGHRHGHEERRARRPADQRAAPWPAPPSPPRIAQRIDLPQREVDGAMGQNGTYTANSGSGTFVSPHAYHVVTTGPVVDLPVQPDHPAVLERRLDADPDPGARHGLHRRRLPDREPVRHRGLPGSRRHPRSRRDHDHRDRRTTPRHRHRDAPDHGLGRRLRLRDPADAQGRHAARSRCRATRSQPRVAQPVGDDRPRARARSTAARTATSPARYVKADKPIVVFTSSERGIGFGGATERRLPAGLGRRRRRRHLLHRSPRGAAAAGHRARPRVRDRAQPDPLDGPDVDRAGHLPRRRHRRRHGRSRRTCRRRTTRSRSTRARRRRSRRPRGFTLVGDQRGPGRVVPRVAALREAGLHRRSEPAHASRRPSSTARTTCSSSRATFQKNYIVIAKPVDATITLDGVPLDERRVLELHEGADRHGRRTSSTSRSRARSPDGHHRRRGDLPFGLSVYGYYNVGATRSSAAATSRSSTRSSDRTAAAARGAARSRMREPRRTSATSSLATRRSDVPSGTAGTGRTPAPAGCDSARVRRPGELRRDGQRDVDARGHRRRTVMRLRSTHDALVHRTSRRRAAGAP